MNLQILKEGEGKNTGVFIPMEDWAMIKSLYPDIEQADLEVPKWEKDLIDIRLELITNSPERNKSGSTLIEELRRKI